MARSKRKTKTRKQSWDEANVGSKGISLKCRNSNCDNVVHNCSSETISVLCGICTSKLVPLQQIENTNTGFLRGWKLMKEFVHSDGTVYQFGVEKPELKGTIKPTDIDSIKKQQKADKEKNKKLKILKKQKREERLLKQYQVGQKERAAKIKQKKKLEEKNAEK